jgi:hypothetical protein
LIGFSLEPNLYDWTAKLVNYMKNVYHLERGLNKLFDGRTKPTYSTGQVNFACAVSRFIA